MKILITGFSGFVSKHFIDYLESSKVISEIMGLDLNDPEFNISNFKFVKNRFTRLDLLNNGSLENLIYTFQPDYILHLASYSSVGFSWKNPSLSFRNNMNIFINLVEIIRSVSPDSRILSVGSSDEYGNVNESILPLKEECPLNPTSPYAVARVSQEQLSKVYCNGFGLDILMSRSFNHIGPGQKDIFVISSFAKQLVEIKKGIKKDTKLYSGDVSIIRDFLDVRDVVDAYYTLLLNGNKGEVYNICSGKGLTLDAIMDIMCGILDIKIEKHIDKNLLRPDDNKIIIGSNEKLKSLGWKQKISLEQSLKDLLDYWYNSL